MNAFQFYRHLKESTPVPVYLFKSDSDFLVDEAWRRLVRSVVPEGARRFNGERLDASQVSAAQVVERLRTLAMFGSKRLVMVDRPDQWNKAQQDAVAAYTSRPNPRACLVLAVPLKKAPKILETAVGAAGLVVEFSAPGEKQAPRWIQQRAQALGKVLTAPAAELLVQKVGPDLPALQAELEKLALYAGERTEIDAEDVDRVVGQNRSVTVFEMVRAAGSRKPREALLALHRLLEEGEPPLAVLALLAREVRILWGIKDGLGLGLAPQEIAQRLQVPLFVVSRQQRSSESFSDDELADVHRRLQDLDYALKSSQVDPVKALESIVYRLSTKKGP